MYVSSKLTFAFILWDVSALKANTDGPEFATTYQKTEQKITVVFMALEVMLHQEAILSVMEYAQSLQPPPTKTPAQEPPAINAEKKPDEVKEKDETEENKPVRKSEII